MTEHLHEALRPWAVAPEVNRAMRAMHREARAAGVAAAPLAFVVLLGGAIPPETVTAGAWRNVEGRRVAVVDLETARDLATGRDPADVLRDIGRPPPRGAAWCLALDATGGCHLWATPLVFNQANAAGGDA